MSYGEELSAEEIDAYHEWCEENGIDPEEEDQYDRYCEEKSKDWRMDY